MESTNRVHSDASSLGSLARRFVEMVETCEGNQIELNQVVKMLNTRKRRIYDITNVLEGVELLEKTSKNNVRWMGPIVDGEEEGEGLMNRIRVLEADLESVEDSIENIHEKIRSLEEKKDKLYLKKSDITQIVEMTNRRFFAVKIPESGKALQLNCGSIFTFLAESENDEIELMDLSSSTSLSTDFFSSGVDEASKENRS